MARTPQLPRVNDVNGLGHPILPTIPELPFTQGNIWHVKPYTGSDVNADGKSPASAFKSLSRALAAAVANQNDIVLLYSEGNSAARCTNYLATTLTWDKDLVHLIGINSGSKYGQRSRLSWASTAASGSDIPLFTISASGCLIKGINFTVGSTDANLSFGVKVTGDRNTFKACCFTFPQNDANDVAGAYALKLDGADECLFQDCMIGSFTIGLGGASNQLLLVDTGISGTVFDNCQFISRIESSTNSPAVRLADAGSVGFGCLWFINHCGFVSTSIGGAVAQNGAFKVTATQTDGRIIMDPTCFTNGAKWDVDDLDMILVSGPPTPAADTPGVLRAV